MFKTKADAEIWARSVEFEIDKGQFVNVSEARRNTLGDVIARYLEEVTPLMKGASEDTIRLKAITRKPIARWSMANLSVARIAAYRDERLKEVSAGTIILVRWSSPAGTLHLRCGSTLLNQPNVRP